jgi:hypothetical protein
MTQSDRELLARASAEDLRFAILIADQHNAEVTRFAFVIAGIAVVASVLFSVSNHVR